jgi:uncharacterized protein (DUF1786 family)
MTASGRLLALDVGTGTTDILVFAPEVRPENSVKLVVPSATQVAAAQVRDATRRGLAVVFAGSTMGGGPVLRAALAHLAAGLAFQATATAALTFDDSLKDVTARGVQLVSDDEVARLVGGGAVLVRSGDADLPALLRALAGFGVPTDFAGGCVAAQDHGFDPHGSNRIFRFAFWERALAARRPLDELFYAAGGDADEVPPEFTRLRAAAGELAALPRVTAADTGPAALLGALGDQPGGARTDAVLVNVGNGHTICAIALEGRLAGIYEDHTHRLDGPLLDTLLRRFLAGELPSDEVRQAGGHGAALTDELRAGVPAGLPVLVTGPNRHLLAGSSLPVRLPAPCGDMMMTGPAGLIAAHRRRYGD